MKIVQRIEFRKFQDDLQKEVSKSKRFKLLFKIESAKLKFAKKIDVEKRKKEKETLEFVA